VFCTPPASQSINSSFLSLWEWERKERIDLIEGVWRPQGNEWVKKWNGWTVSFAAAATMGMEFEFGLLVCSRGDYGRSSAKAGSPERRREKTNKLKRNVFWRRREQRANKPQMNSWICGLWACRSSPRKHPFIDFIHHSINSFGFLGCSAEKRQAHTNKQPKKRGHPTLSLLWVDCWLRVFKQ